MRTENEWKDNKQTNSMYICNYIGEVIKNFIARDWLYQDI